MKKSLVLAMAMALGVTASAYAANPFSDVPAGHWAYDSVAELAAAGVVDGYADGTFGGDKLMTRYEMAQIVAKAMANGANVDKLAAEFADELDNLGVRVANLEKKADNVKITGQIRAHYKDFEKDGVGQNDFKLRTRLFVNGQINDDWSFTARLQNEQDFTDNDVDGKVAGDGAEEETKLNWAFVDGRVGGVKVTAGRQDVKVRAGNVIDNTSDAVKLAYGKDIKLSAWGAKAVDKVTKLSEDRFYAVDLGAKLGVVDVFADYYKADKKGLEDIYAVGASMNIAKGLKLNAEYLKGDAEAGKDDDGFVVGLKFGGASAAKVGSWGLYANYYDQAEATYYDHTVDAYATLPGGTDGFEGYEVGANYTLAKNIVAGVKYFDLEAREGKGEAETLWSEVIFTF